MRESKAKWSGGRFVISEQTKEQISPIALAQGRKVREVVQDFLEIFLRLAQNDISVLRLLSEHHSRGRKARPPLTVSLGQEDFDLLVELSKACNVGLVELVEEAVATIAWLYRLLAPVPRTGRPVDKEEFVIRARTYLMARFHHQSAS